MMQIAYDWRFTHVVNVLVAKMLQISQLNYTALVSSLDIKFKTWDACTCVDIAITTGTEHG